MPSTNYCTLADFKSYASIPSTKTDDDATIAINTAAAFNAINNYCGRVFATSTGSRVFEAKANSYCIEIDDVSSATGVTVSHDTGNDGTYDTTWASTDYELRPLNGLLNGQPWAYTEIRAVGNQTFPFTFQFERAHIQVSATWGWPAVPADVTNAAYLLVMDLFKSKDAPFGVAGTSEFGNLRVSSNVAGMAKLMLAPYRKFGVLL